MASKRNTQTQRRIRVLGTGGTIAGRRRGDHSDYVAGQVAVADLLIGIAQPDGVALTAEQIAQVDSKDMDCATWKTLALRCAQALADPGIDGIVITHGTDTLEESAFFLHQVLRARKPVVFACAMRPADSPESDGPRNLRDAIIVAAQMDVAGVMAVCAGRIHAAVEVRKVHSHQLDAFSSGEAGPLGEINDGAVRWLRGNPAAPAALAAPATPAPGLIEAIAATAAWPRVEIITSHAGASGALIDHLVRERASGESGAVRGLVLAATGNGTVHREIEAAALRAQAAGIAIVRATRCADGGILPRTGATLRDAGALSPVKARIALMLELLTAPVLD